MRRISCLMALLAVLGAGRAWGQEPEGYEAPDFKDLVASLQGLFEIVPTVGAYDGGLFGRQAASGSQVRYKLRQSEVFVAGTVNLIWTERYYDPCNHPEGPEACPAKYATTADGAAGFPMNGERANEVTLRFMKERGKWKLDTAKFVATSGGTKTPWDCEQVRKRAASHKSPFWTQDILCERLEKQAGLKR